MPCPYKYDNRRDTALPCPDFDEGILSLNWGDRTEMLLETRTR
jgi:hypothetical protein